MMDRIAEIQKKKPRFFGDLDLDDETEEKAKVKRPSLQATLNTTAGSGQLKKMLGSGNLA
jgi:hypothetical protein